MTNNINGNLFDLENTTSADHELFESLATGDVLIERIVSRGHTTPEDQWYDQEKDEWVVLLTGEAAVLFDDGREVSLKPGDYLMIPAHSRHRVTHTSTQPACIWLAIHGHFTTSRQL